MMYKTIGIVAHVDAGKTTFSEQLLYHMKAIRSRGRVDHQDAFLDSHAIERNRGITVFADQASFTYNGNHYTWIDTPGHVDFSPEMERAVQVMDFAILLISAADGIEGHTETVWQLLKKHGIPVFFFINKMDRESADLQQVIQDIKTQLTPDLFAFCDMQDNCLSNDLLEFIAERDDRLLQLYIEGDTDSPLYAEALQNMISSRQAFGFGYGSALTDDGVKEFMAIFDRLTKTHYDPEASFAARIYKIRHEENGQRLTFLKVLSGSVRVRQEMTYNGKTEKITQIRKYNGTSYTAADSIQAGEIAAVTGLSEAQAGDAAGDAAKAGGFSLVPSLTSRVMYDSAIHPQDMMRCLMMIDAEDPSLQTVYDEHAREIHVHVMGVIQLSVLQTIVKERFSYDISFGDPKIRYQETIRSAVIGYGHFEPLKHYAEVHLKIEPAPRGSGISFVSECHTDDLQPGQQNLIRGHLFEKSHRGILTGAPVTDVTVTLLRGKGHPEHTSGGDFREATLRALRQGLEKADNLLLEPYYDYKIKVDNDQIGRVLSDIQTAAGSFDPPETDGLKTTVTGRVPVATFLNYSKLFASYTNGKGMLTLQSGGYDVCHNADDVIEAAGYDKDADPEYTSSSIFCAKGKGYAVPWDEAEAAMHLL